MALAWAFAASYPYCATAARTCLHWSSVCAEAAWRHPAHPGRHQRSKAGVYAGFDLFRPFRPKHFPRGNGLLCARITLPEHNDREALIVRP